ncbi:MAG TPA: anti-sigma factor [Opitutaceae bacterium]|jgi:anti-sigma-K factor RskA
MIDELLEEQASLYALGLLEGRELSDFESAMAASEELRARSAELRVAAASLAHAAPDAEPPPALRERVLASAAGRGRQPSKAPAFPFWVPWLAAACLAGAAIVSQHRYSQAEVRAAAIDLQKTEALAALAKSEGNLADAKRLVTEYSRQVAELSTRLKDEGDLAHFRIATLASMLGNSPAALAVAVWDPAREKGVLEVSHLPAAAAEKDYQLWVIDKAYASPVSAGVFSVDPASGEAHVVFTARKPVRSIAKFAVSVERRGGSQKPEGPIVLLGP